MLNVNQLEPTYWERRLKRLEKRLAAEQEFFQCRQELIKSAELLAKRREATLGKSERPQLSIIGIPAKLLLELLA